MESASQDDPGTGVAPAGEATRAAVGEVFERLCSDRRIPGLSFGLVTRDGLAHHGATGVADVASGREPSASTVFRIASMTKSFTAMCVLMLRDGGALSLEDPAASLVPELASWQGATDDSPAVSIASLLSMTSGLVEDDPWADRLLDLDARGFSRLLSGGVGFDHPPGTAYEYSNLGYAVLGRVIEAASGLPLKDLVRRRLLEPLGMGSTTFDADSLRAEGAATGYRLERGTFVEEPPLADGAFGAMGGLASSVDDLARYVRLHLGAWPARDGADEGPLRRSSLREMTLPRSFRELAAPGPAEGHPARVEGYGFGLVTTLDTTGTRSVGHSGALPGFSSHMEWLPDLGIGMVALANRTYVPVRLAVREALALWREGERLGAPALPPGAALAAAQRAVSLLYERDDPDVLAGSFLPTYLLDLDDDRRAPDFAALRAQHGRVIDVGPIVATGALRGSWSMRCESATLEVMVMLGPPLPSRIQFATVEPRG